MHIQAGRFVADCQRAANHHSHDDRLAERLFAMRAIRAGDLRHARAVAEHLHLPLAEALAGSGMVMQDDLACATAWLAGLPLTDPLADPPDPRLVERLGPQRCLAMGLVPLRVLGGEVLIALAQPSEWPRHAAEIAAALGPVRLSHAPLPAIQQAVASAASLRLRLQAEARVPAPVSARAWRGLAGWRLATLAILLGLVLAVMPMVALAVVLAWLVVSIAATSLLRATALILALRRPRTAAPAPPLARPLRWPVISILVPLYGEPDIAPRLLQRLGRLDYPRALMDVVIVLEAKDTETRAALAGCPLPGWMRIVTVPDGPITTKPRAMNYALDFCRGSIIGIYDAEDAPDPDQLQKVVQRFAERGPDVACLQGCLDYYNPRTNLLARLFTAEYASWFRVVMPALQRLRLPMPLGGTTLFLRREALDRVGAWDAHNVTEDADLGVRLARHGLRTEMLPTTTHEEANCRLHPWIRQRSRWIKGHILTWAIHMRDPVGLWRDLGWRGFLGYQVVFLGAQSQVLLAPLMWTMWAISVGLPHPMQTLLPVGGVPVLIAMFLLSEALVMATAVVGMARTRHRGLWPVVPMLHLYHPLGAIAGWRAVWEAFRNPFYWAKTSHGHFDHAVGDGQALWQAPNPAPADGTALHRPPNSPFRAAPDAIAAVPVGGETAADRIARALRQGLSLADLPEIRAQPSLPGRVRTSPASIFRRVSKAREICVRSAS